MNLGVEVCYCTVDSYCTVGLGYTPTTLLRYYTTTLLYLTIYSSQFSSTTKEAGS